MKIRLPALLLGCIGLVLPAVLGDHVRWCTISAPENRKCKDLQKSVTHISCVQKDGVDACIQAIKNKEADAITLDGGDIYRAGLHPIIAEDYGIESNTCYFAVAVVRRGSGFGFNELRWSKSCHTGLWKSAGWVVPIGTLLAQGQIQWNRTGGQSIEEAVSDFFSASCVPGANPQTGLCQLCKGNCARSQDEPYYGYDGAFQCLKEGKGEVAFVKHTTVPAEESANFELLCRDGSRRDISDYASCHLTRVPAHAVVSRKNPRLADEIWKLLTHAMAKFPLFSSETYESKNLMFKDSAVSLVRLPETSDMFTYLGGEYLSIVRSVYGDLSPSAVTWCAVGTAERRKCMEWKFHSMDGQRQTQLECTNGTSVDECIRKILRDEADAMSMDGGEVYTAGGCGLVPAMAEQYDEANCASGNTVEASYYAVAVVKEGTGFTWKDLRGKKSCHTGIGRTAGWNIPLGIIHNTTRECNFETFFNESCAPGADPRSSLCALCVGDGTAKRPRDRCQASTDEQYFGYTGAFRCLAEGGGDVAFVKHTTVLENTDGQGPSWATGLQSAGFELLCPTGPGRSPISEYLNCHLAKAPTHAVMTRPERRNDVVSFLNMQQERFGPGSPNAFKLFESRKQKNLLFKDSTKCLLEVPAGQSYRSFLGEEYFKSVSSLRQCTGAVSALEQACTSHICQQRA
ncbi:hypothetical protein GJAV_G00055630 [Gymnothorax javanicus]|nr:hypothetical protein GJAV_G00055630 [Gymnothorax javanicus]